ncbi:MAG: hypothetical protein DMD96_26535 [Candidatus Rokuibacteriota bacterium]|nr:MAG: hypothetical protein DMD96_26535 [Candidatus Rokubacteria bacterium]
MRESAHIASRPTLLPLALTGGVLCFLLLLVPMGTPTRVIDAVVHFDVSVFAFFSRFAGRSWTVDTLIWSVWTQAAVQGGVVMVLVWGAWFSQGETPESRQTRAAMLSSLVGVYACILLTLVLRVVLPFRARPMVDPTSAFQMPYLPNGAMPTAESTSFPSGHAAVLFALAIGLWSISRTLGIVAGFHGLFVVCLPRVYFGRHWATDIVAGAGVALATVPMVNEVLRRSSLVPRLLGWSERRPAAFYSVFFLCSMDIAMDFAFVKTALKLVSILQLVRGVHITRVVMWIVTGTAPA